MTIYDPIHGYIELEKIFKQLIDTKQFQRLRRIKQLGTTYLLFPSTTHTRFEHSLGVFYLAGEYAKQLNLNEQEKKTLQAAGLLHDIGHGPFSHVIETIFEDEDIEHEDLSIRKIKSDPISSILKNNGVKLQEVEKLILGKGKLGSIIAGGVDVDRMDYLIRDSYYSGVAHGTIDRDTIIRAAELREGNLIFQAKHKEALEGLLIARNLMKATIYFNETVLVADRMIQKAVHYLVRQEQLTADEISLMDDIDLKQRLRATENEIAHYLNQKLDQRQLFKKAIEIKPEQLNITKGAEVDVNGLEQNLAQSCEIHTKKLVVDSPHSFGDYENIKIKVSHNGSISTLTEISDMVQALTHSSSLPHTLRVYTEESEKEKLQDNKEKIISTIRN